jgi:hypothetical protein
VRVARDKRTGRSLSWPCRSAPFNGDRLSERAGTRRLLFAPALTLGINGERSPGRASADDCVAAEGAATAITVRAGVPAAKRMRAAVGA